MTTPGEDSKCRTLNRTECLSKAIIVLSVMVQWLLPIRLITWAVRESGFGSALAVLIPRLSASLKGAITMSRGRAIAAGLAIWCFAGWLYVILRILLNGSDAWWTEEFIMGIPVSFWMIGIGFFVLGFLGTIVALTDNK